VCAVHVFFSSQKAKTFCKHGSAITLGNFDGLHEGHRALLKKLILEAKKRKIPSVLYTFHPHPVKVLSPQSAPSLINTLDQKIEMLRNLNLDAVVFEKFSKPFARNSAEDFFHKIILGTLKAKALMVGYDFTFGANREGNIERLEEFCRAHDVKLFIMKPCFEGNTLVSSSLVRKFVLEGRVDVCNSWLKRPYFIDGIVVSGAHRGNKLGFPTLNLKTENELLPKMGTYATWVEIKNKRLESVTNIGTNPTFEMEQNLKIETHILNFHQKIYGHKIRLFFVKRLRDEKRFSNARELAAQIKKDIAHAKLALKETKNVKIVL